MLLKRVLKCVLLNKKATFRDFSNFLKQRTIAPNDLLRIFINKDKIKNVDDWKNVRNEILNKSGPRGLIKSSNIDAMAVGMCTSKKEYDLGLSYMEFLKKEEIKPNLGTLGKYFKLLYQKGVADGLSLEDENRILKLYEDVRASHPVLDGLTLDGIIPAISLTKQWKLCLDLLKEAKILSSPSSLSYSAIVAAAFSNNEDGLAWNLLNETLERDRAILSVVYSTYFKKLSKQKKDTIIKDLEAMFNFLHKNALVLEKDSIEDLIELRRAANLTVRASTMNHRGLCKCCKKTLKSFDLSESEFSDLKNKIIKNVIIGKDIFNKTTADELKKFQDFIANMKNFDVVIDGLNVAYSVGTQQSPLVTSGLVQSVVAYFTNQGKKVLVLGRHHMSRWPKSNWEFVMDNATVFLTENLSQDDPYFLYCALQSGRDTIVVSRDLMRGHKFLLRSPQLKLLFDRWLSQRQYQLLRVQNSGVPIFRKPLPFTEIAQKVDGCWHIPYTNDFQDKNSFVTTWLCIQK